MKNIIGIIPARMGSSRFPGKPLAAINGIPMIGHVYFRSKMCSVLEEVYVATCDPEIADYMKKIGVEAVMTADSHQRASDRAAEALEKIEVQTRRRVDIVVMIQGDEPMLRPTMIEESVSPMLKDETILVTNLMKSITKKEEFEDRNEIKVVVDRNSNALYFSRAPIPHFRQAKEGIYGYKQVCIIPFKRDFLIEFNNLEPGNLEKIESIDMLRVLEHSFAVRMINTDFETYSVDTPADLGKVADLMKNDPLVPDYIKHQ